MMRMRPVVLRRIAGTRRASSASVAAIHKQITATSETVRLRPAVPPPLAEQAAACPQSRTDRHGVFEQHAWFKATSASQQNPMPAVRALENAAKAGSNVQLLDALAAVRSIGDAALRLVQVSVFHLIIQRIVGTETPFLFMTATPSTEPTAFEPFVNLMGASRAQAVEQARTDLARIAAQSPSTVIDIATDLLVMRSARFYPVNQLNQAVHLFETISGKSVNSSSQSAQDQQQVDASKIRRLAEELAGVFAAAGHIGMCKAMIAAMIKTDMPPGIPMFLRLIEAYCRSNDMVSAENLADRVMSNGTPNEALRAAELLLCGYSLSGNLTKSTKYFNKCMEMTKPSKSANHMQSIVEMDNKQRMAFQTTIHNMLMRAYCERGLPGDVFNLYTSMREKSIESNTETFLCLIRVYGRSKNLKSAVKMFYELERVSSNFTPSSEMVSALIEAYMIAGETQLAWRLLASALDPPKKSNHKFKGRYVGGPHSIHKPSEQQHRSSVAQLSVESLSSNMVLPMARNLSGKHMDYLRDLIKFSQMPEAVRPILVARLMEAALVADVHKSADPELAVRLYDQYDMNSGCAATPVIPIDASVAAIKAFGMLGKTDEAVKVFESAVEDAVVAGKASGLYASVLGALSRSTASTHGKTAIKLVKKMQTSGVEMTVDVLENFAACAESVGADAHELRDRLLSEAAKELRIVPLPSMHPCLTTLVGNDVAERICDLAA